MLYSSLSAIFKKMENVSAEITEWFVEIFFLTNAVAITESLNNNISYCAGV